MDQFVNTDATVSDADAEQDDLAERAAQLVAWLESEVRLLSVDDVSEDERDRMEERAETARQLSALFFA